MKLRNALMGAVASIALASVVVAQPYGMGLGMGGWGSGYGMAQSMMGGYGGGPGAGPGMMGGYSGEAYAGLDLSAEQRKKIADIQQETSRAMWQLMGTMHGQGYHMQGMFGPGALDEAAARKSFQTMADTQKAMFEMQLEARKRIDAVLTKEQREKLHRYWSSR